MRLSTRVLLAVGIAAISAPRLISGERVREPVAGQPLPELPSQHFRPLGELPRDAVQNFKNAKGGVLTQEAERDLRIFDHVFRRVDANRDGRLDAREFTLSRGGERRGLEKAVLLALDANKDFQLSKAEAKAAWKSLGELDRNSDERLTSRELQGAASLFARRAFARADTNGDGAVDFGEYALWQDRLPRVTTR